MAFKDISLRTREARKQTIRIVHEDDDLLVLDKPPGIPVVPDHWDPEKINLYDLLNSQLIKDAIPGSEKIWIVHRIDQDQSVLTGNDQVTDINIRPDAYRNCVNR